MFHTSFGHCRFTRQPCANKIFQIEIGRDIDSIKGAKNVQDDIIVWSSDLNENYQKLKHVFYRIRQNSLKIN